MTLLQDILKVTNLLKKKAFLGEKNLYSVSDNYFLIFKNARVFEEVGNNWWKIKHLKNSDDNAEKNTYHTFIHGGVRGSRCG